MLRWTTLQPPTPPVIIPGFHREVIGRAPELQTSSKYLWGLKGNVVIIGNISKRDLSCSMWFNDPTWEQAVQFYDQYAVLESLVGAYGTLEVLNDPTAPYWPTSQEQTFTNMLFMPFETQTFNGQQFWSPIRDEAASLYCGDPTHDGKKTWLAQITLNFMQTVPDRDYTPIP